MEETLREGARQLLQQALENKVQEFLDSLKKSKTGEGRHAVVRNGYLPEEKYTQTSLEYWLDMLFAKLIYAS